MVTKVYRDGKVLDERTAKMFDLWQFNALTDFYILQGSYNHGVGASAGTHDGGGAVDLSVSGFSDKFTRWVVKQGRLAGFAAWYRSPLPGVWSEHIHAIALGCKDAAPLAKTQMIEYRNGGDGLVGSAPDNGPKVRIRVYPNVSHKPVGLLTANRQFKSKNPKRRMTVKRIQWVLNEKVNAGLVVDGIAGKKTREAYAKWERKSGVDKKFQNGVPNKHDLKELGKGRFRVKTASYERWQDEQKNRKHSKPVQRILEAKNPDSGKHH